MQRKKDLEGNLFVRFGKIFIKEEYMSRIGKKPIEIPVGVEVNFVESNLTVKGAKGTLDLVIHEAVGIEIEEREIIVNKKRNSKIAQAMWGTTRALISNMIIGVTDEFKKTLLLDGVGFRMALKGNQIDLALGFSHPVLVDIPDGIKVEIEKSKMIISGINKQKVGQFASEIRAFKPVEPYKGKGFRYDDEQVIRKEGKRAVAG